MGKDNKDFFVWLDSILKDELNNEVKAINFNLYEDADNKWSIELVGTFFSIKMMKIGLVMKYLLQEIILL